MKEDIEIVPRKDTIKWLHILLSQKISKMKEEFETISVLNHQIQHFNGMAECFQNQVITDINDMFVRLKWKYKISEEVEDGKR